MPAFEFSTSVFRLVRKLDSAFVALLQPAGHSTDGLGSRLSMTDKVRIKSLIEETRVTAVNCASSAGYAASVPDLSSDDDTEDEEDAPWPDDGPIQNDEAIGMALSKIYKRTLEILGDSLA